MCVCVCVCQCVRSVDLSGLWMCQVTSCSRVPFSLRWISSNNSEFWKWVRASVKVRAKVRVRVRVKVRMRMRVRVTMRLRERVSGEEKVG